MNENYIQQPQSPTLTYPSNSYQPKMYMYQSADLHSKHGITMMPDSGMHYTIAPPGPLPGYMPHMMYSEPSEYVPSQMNYLHAHNASIEHNPTNMMMIHQPLSSPVESSYSTIPTPVTQPEMKPTKKKRMRRKLTEVQKIAHNKIEKRYRTNINDKIFDLHTLLEPDWQSHEDKDAAGFSSSDEGTKKRKFVLEGKLNKSSILEKAAEYIIYLKKTNAKLKDQNSDLKKQLSIA